MADKKNQMLLGAFILFVSCRILYGRFDILLLFCHYYAAFNAPCAGRKDGELQARESRDLRLAVSVRKSVT